MILSLESSCDETALALLNTQTGALKEWISTQMDLHETYGGVVPDLASRAHLQQFPRLLQQIQKESQPLRDHPNLEAIAVTVGPGLAGCLAIGIAVAKALSTALNLPLYGVNHLRAHAFSVFIPGFQRDPEHFREKWADFLPHLGLLVSGGNTLLFLLDQDLHIQIVGDTRDDAAGEALDKGAKLLGLAYPGGPLVEKFAREGDPSFYPFPRAEKSKESGDFIPFSFSGLKTSLRYYLEKVSDEAFQDQFQDLCASYQEAVVDQLVQKTRSFLQESGASIQSLGLSGGVANNGLLRERWSALSREWKLPLLIAERAHCGDNASMIAFNAHFDKKGVFSKENTITFQPSLPLDYELY